MVLLSSGENNEVKICSFEMCIRDRVYEAASEVERKEFMRAFIERIELFPEKQPDGNWIRKIIFNFPVPVKDVYKRQPFHDDRHPSMKLNRDYFYSFGCGATGDVIDFVARLFGLSSYEAAKKLAYDFGIDPDKPPAAMALKKPYPVSYTHLLLLAGPVSYEHS